MCGHPFGRTPQPRQTISQTLSSQTQPFVVVNWRRGRLCASEPRPCLLQVNLVLFQGSVCARMLLPAFIDFFWGVRCCMQCMQHSLDCDVDKSCCAIGISVVLLLLLAACACVALRCSQSRQWVVCNRRNPTYILSCFSLRACCYVWLPGPEFARWHLSDCISCGLPCLVVVLFIRRRSVTALPLTVMRPHCTSNKRQHHRRCTPLAYCSYLLCFCRR